MADYTFERMCRSVYAGKCGKVGSYPIENTGFFKCPYCLRPNGCSGQGDRLVSEEVAKELFETHKDKVKDQENDVS